MKKTLSILLLSLVFVCVSAVFAFGAEVQYPVLEVQEHTGYVDEIGKSKAENGRTYVPLRLLFEHYDAAVDWNGADRTITVKRCDGAVIQMRLGSKTAVISHLGKTKKLIMDVTPKAENGKTWVPLRFVAENLMCDVLWDSSEKAVKITPLYFTDRFNGNRYTFDFQTEQVYELSAGGSVKRLGKISGIKAYGKRFGGAASDITSLRKTENGNYVITASKFASTTYDYLAVYLNLRSGEGRFFIKGYLGSDKPSAVPCIDKNTVWFPYDRGVWAVDDSDGKIVREYAYADLLKSLDDIKAEGFYFAEGEYMLLRYTKASNAEYLPFVNLQTGEIVELTEVLVPAADREEYFSNDSAFPSCFLRFVNGENRRLLFEYLTYDEMNKQHIKNVEYKY
ncbi:MAG: copper amine oxidase N-terminal domain-containing protein [Bacillota bacterium]|jgi:hypothetical protein